MSSKLASWIPEHWGAVEREVWGCIETHWDHLINKRVDQFIKYIHPAMVGYGHESPIPVDHLRPSIPDSDRTGYTLGYGYAGKRWGLDVYAMQLQFKDVTANGSFFEGVVNGTYKSSILLVGLTGKYRF